MPLIFAPPPGLSVMEELRHRIISTICAFLNISSADSQNKQLGRVLRTKKRCQEMIDYLNARGIHNPVCPNSRRSITNDELWSFIYGISIKDTPKFFLLH